MGKAQRQVLLVGFLLVGLVSLFPPRTYSFVGEHVAHFKSNERFLHGLTASRGFLLSIDGQYSEENRVITGSGMSIFRVEIDLARWFCEVGLIIAVTLATSLCVYPRKPVNVPASPFASESGKGQA